MSQDDFSLVAEERSRLEEIADAAMIAAAPTPPVSEGVDPVMTKEELIAAAESIGMRFPGASIPPVSEDRKDAERYRWLRSQQIDLNAPRIGVLRSGIFVGKIPDNVVLSEADADAEIDAAMEGK